MVMTVKPDMTKIWAATGATAVPPDAKIASGWGYEMMPFEWENWIQNRNDSMLSHINQRGIPEWDAASEYFANKSYVTGSNGLVYATLVDNTNVDPVSDVTGKWVRAFPSVTGGGASGTWSIAISGNAATATQLATARTINTVSFNGSANIVVEPYVERDDSTNATRYLSFVDSSTAGHQRLNMDLNLTYNPSTNTISTSIAGNSGTATKWATARSISIAGDATWTTSIDGSADVTGVLTLANSGVTAGTYNNVATAVTPITVDAKGRVTATGAAVTITPAFSDVTGKPTTLTGYGITDATPFSHVGSTGASHGVVTTSVAGFMSAADKTKLDGLSAPGGAALVGYGGGTVATALEAAAPITTQGDLVVGGAGGIPARLPKGVDGKVLKMVSGAPAWGDEAGGGGGASDAASVTSANGGSVQDVIGVSIKSKGGAGDGVTSDQTAVAAAIAAGFESVLVNDNAKFLVTSLANTRGVDLEGYGHIVKAITGGLQKLNSYGDKHQYVFGREYLAAFHNLLIAQSTTATRKPIMVFSGDSTTAGDGVSADYQIDDLLKLAGECAGLQTPYGLSSINRGQSGKNTEHWRTTYLAGDLAANPDLLVLRWGINDPGYYSSDYTTGPALGAGQSAPGRRTVDDFLTSLRAGLATIRASRNVASLSIVLMTPNSTSDTPNARDELWYEQIIPGIKQAARDFQCTFIDTYAYLRDSRPAAGVWMDNPFGDGRGIHPLNVMNMWVAGLMADVIFPAGLRQKIGLTNIRQIGGAEDIGDVSRPPSYYKPGITVSRAVALSEGFGTAWPVGGSVVTIRSVDETAIQILYPFRDVERGSAYFRAGSTQTLGGVTPTWGSWVALGGAGPTSAANVATSAGYGIPATGQARAVKSGNQVICEGYITKTTPTTLAAGTIVGTLPAGFRPVSEAAYWNAVIWDGGSGFAYVVARVSPSGTIDVATATPISVARIWLNVNFSTLA